MKGEERGESGEDESGVEGERKRRRENFYFVHSHSR